MSLLDFSHEFSTDASTRTPRIHTIDYEALTESVGTYGFIARSELVPGVAISDLLMIRFTSSKEARYLYYVVDGWYDGHGIEDGYVLLNTTLLGRQSPDQ